MSKRHIATAVLVALLTTGTPAGWACDLCAIYEATEAEGGSGQGFFGGAAEQFTHFGTFQSGGHNASNPDGEYLKGLTSRKVDLDLACA